MYVLNQLFGNSCNLTFFFRSAWPQHEGDFSFREAWFHLSDEYPIKYEAERLPPPVVADLNGDGRKEVLVATHDAKIQVINLKQSSFHFLPKY